MGSIGDLWAGVVATWEYASKSYLVRGEFPDFPQKLLPAYHMMLCLPRRCKFYCHPNSLMFRFGSESVAEII